MNCKKCGWPKEKHDRQNRCPNNKAGGFLKDSTFVTKKVNHEAQRLRWAGMKR